MPYLFLLSIFFLAACGQNASDQLSQSTSVADSDNPADVATRVFVNGNILTVDDNFSIAQAIAIKDDRIMAIGNNESVLALAGAQTITVDLQGGTVVPGLIDNHNHFVRASEQWYRQVRWDEVNSRADALAMLQERAAILPVGEWVVVLGGWIFEQFSDDQSEFDRSELDALLPDNPVYIQQGYGRAYANTEALLRTGILESNDVFPGLMLENGDPTGVLIGSGAFLRVANNISVTSDSQWDESLQLAINDYLAQGLTTLLDIGGNTVTPRHYEAVARAAANDNLDMRVFYTLNSTNGVGPTAEEIITALTTNSPRSGNDRFGQFTYGEMTYTGIRDPNGAPWNPTQAEFDNYEEILQVAAEQGWQIHEHSTRDDKMQATLDIIARVNETVPVADLRWTIAHAENASDATITRARELGVVFAIHSSGGLGAVARAAQGVDVSRIPPIRQINEAGVLWGLGSDGTVVSGFHPFQNIGWAVTGMAKSGQQLLTATVSREDALRAHTYNNAYLLSKEDVLGSLEPGKYADLVILDRNYMTIPAEQIKDIKATMTMVSGEIVFERQ